MATSKLDMKHKRDELLQDKGLEFWQETVAQLKIAAQKMQAYFNVSVGVEVSPDLKVVRLTGAEVRHRNEWVRPDLLLTFDNQTKAVQLRREDLGRATGSFPLRAWSDGERLGFTAPQKFYGSLEFAEHIVAEVLSEINLDD